MTYEDVSTLSVIVDTSHDLAYRFIICLFFLSQQCAYSQDKHSVLLMPVMNNFKGMLLPQYVFRIDRYSNSHVEITK